MNKNKSIGAILMVAAITIITIVMIASYIPCPPGHSQCDSSIMATIQWGGFGIDESEMMPHFFIRTLWISIGCVLIFALGFLYWIGALKQLGLSQVK